MTFKIGEAYVEVNARVDKDGIKRDIDSALSGAEKSASSSGSKIGKSIGDGISTAFGELDKTIHVKIKESGDRSGSTLMSSIGNAVKNGSASLVGGLGDALSNGMSAASKMAGPVLIGALGGVMVAAGPTLGAALGGAIVLGLGAGLVGIGAMLLLQDEKIKAQFAKTGNEIKTIMTDAAKPLLPAMEHAMQGVKKLVQDFAPTFSSAFKQAEVPLKNFTDQLLGAFKNLKPAIQPLMTGFTDLLGQIGPQLGGIFKSIGSSLADLGRAVSENKSVLGMLFTGLLQTIPLVISGIGGIVSFFGTLASAVMSSASAMTGGFSNVTNVVLGFAEKFLGAIRSIASAMANIPGMEGIANKMIQGIDKAIAKVGEWKKSAADLAKGIEIKANILDLTQKIDAAKAQLNDPNLTKERRAQLNADIAKLQSAKAAAVAALGDPKLVKEYKSQITTEIATLKSRIAEAKRELQSPDLTKERRSKLNADIAQLQSQVAAAKAALNSVQNKTVTLTVLKYTREILEQKNKEYGGIEKYASGTVRRSTPPTIATRPTILYGEGRDDEAFIPYDKAMRGRATKILGEVAGDFGYQLSPTGAKAASGGGSVTNYFNVTLNARDMAEMRTAVDFFNKVQSMSRAGAR